MSKIEKTLEVNITHELLTLADSFWWFLSHTSLRRYWRPSSKLPFIPLQKAYATGLPITLEGRTGGGYDISINSPGLFGSPARVLFLQFKAGEHKDYHSDSKSIFFGDPSKPKPHVEFTFNNNTKRNQHKLLQDLQAAKKGFGHPVLYVFPRITTDAEVRKYAGKLMHRTSFISIADIDTKATIHNVTITSGTIHKFRSCYKDYNKNEVNFFLFLFDGPDDTKYFLAEVVAIRVMRALEQLKMLSEQLPTIYMNNVAEAFIQLFRFLADYFDLDFYEERKSILEVVSGTRLYSKIREMNSEDQINPSTNRIRNERNAELFYAIISALKPFYFMLEDRIFGYQIEIPEAPQNYTYKIDSNGLRFTLDDGADSDDFADISYSVL